MEFHAGRGMQWYEKALDGHVARRGLFRKKLYRSILHIMKYTLIGLGNPGAEYSRTPHNIGREVVEAFVKGIDKKAVWKVDKKANALVYKFTGDGLQFTGLAALPETFMNNSGKSAAALVVGPKNIANTVVVHDDLDLPLGTLKLCFDRGSGGHNGVKSVTKFLKTEEYIRLRIGVSPHSAAGKIKKVQGEEDVIDFILKPFPKKYEDEVKVVYKTALKMLAAVCEGGVQKAMTEYN
jgi:peptidyl-tRNA hydrolase, PTH1 family